MDSLGEGLVDPGDDDQDFRLFLDKALRRGPEQGRGLVDHVQDHPGQGEQGGAGPDHLQVQHAPHAKALLGHHLPGEADGHLRVEDLVGPFVGAAEDQGGLAFEAGNGGPFGEQDPGRGPRHPGEDDAGQHRNRTQADEAFHRHQQVGVEVCRGHAAIADGAEGLHTEEEGVSQRPQAVARSRRGLQRPAGHPGPVRPEQQGEDPVDGQVGDGRQGQEPGPGGGEQLVVEVIHARPASADDLDPVRPFPPTGGAGEGDIFRPPGP